MNIMKSGLSFINKISGSKISLPFMLVICIMFWVSPNINLNAQDQSGKSFYVSPDGSDSNPGTISQPMATLNAARDAARNAPKGVNKIILMPGEYYISGPLELDSRDNGLTIESQKSGQSVLYGGIEVKGWMKEGDKFWYAELPGVKEGTWDFRALVVNGRLVERARFPDTATFFHRQAWDVKVLPAIAGYWERQPLPEERIIMAYDPKDLPDNLDIRNAELRIYHMWNESLVGIKHNDLKNHIFTLSTPAIYPPGAFGVKKYVVWNTREGMTRPGRWYLDRTAGRVVYWPMPGEDMKEAKVIAPKTEQIIRISGTQDKKVEKIFIRGLSLQVTNIPLQPGGWAGASFNGALNIEHAVQFTIDSLEVFNVGGVGLSTLQVKDFRIMNCNIHKTGGCGLKLTGSDTYISGNRVHNIGVYYPSSAAIYANGERLHVYRNEIFNGPYTGMIIGGADNLIEENHISRVMQEMHDGAAIYCSGKATKRTVIRGNLVRDIVAVGKGFGVSAYYFDEGASDGIVERNISIGVGRPTHNHIAWNITYRDNVFITDGDMAISFQRSANCHFIRNTLVAPGRINMVQPNAIKTWKDNVVYRNGQIKDNVLQSFTVDSLMPPYTIPGRRSQMLRAINVKKAPVLDGILDLSEWPGEFFTMDREPSRLAASGAPVLVKLSHDDKFIYLGSLITMFDPLKISMGSSWGINDGLEVSLEGQKSGKEPAAHIIRLYADGTIQFLNGAETGHANIQQVPKDLKSVVKLLKDQPRGGGWHFEMAIPLKSLGIKPAKGLKVPINIRAFVNEYGNWHSWEGNNNEIWQADQAGLMILE